MTTSKTQKLDNALKKLRLARRKLDGGTSRIKRRNARRAFIGALRSVRLALDAEYPRLDKLKAAKAPKAESKPADARLPFNRAWDIDAARLFIRLATDSYSLSVTIEAHEGVKPKSHIYPGTIYFGPAWSSRQKWHQLIIWLVRHRGHTFETAFDLWRRFWSEPVPITDLSLAAEHQVFIEKQEARTAAARKAVATRKGNDHAEG